MNLLLIVLITVTFQACSVPHKKRPAIKAPEPTANFEEPRYDDGGYGIAYPNKALTPGSVVDATREDVCAPGYSKRMRAKVSKQTKALVYYRYGLKYDSKHFQIDHLIPISIGGSNDPDNLWPQPIINNYGFREKQKVAAYLHNQVCADKMDIRDAQEMIRVDWHAVYSSMGEKN